MSGGHFEYDEFKLVGIIDTLSGDIELSKHQNCVPVDEYEHHRMSDESIKLATEMISDLERLYHNLRQYDLYKSSDSNEDDFISRYK